MSGLYAAILNFSPSLTSGTMDGSTVELLDSENGGVVTIVLLSAIEADICNLSVVNMEKQIHTLDCSRYFDFPGGG